MDYLNAFITGGILCLIAQILISKTNMTTAKILVLYVVAGNILTAIGIYGKIADFGGCGATIPLTGFGYSLAKGAIEGAKESGIIGALGGGIKATAPGVAVSILCGLIAGAFFKPKTLK